MSAATASIGPEIPSLEIEAIQEMATVDQWVLWQLEGEPNSEGKRNKTPKNPRGFNASSINPKTWSSYEVCAQAFVAGSFEGLGFVFSSEDDYVGVDFDHILDDDLKIKDPSIAKWVADLNSYTEISPSGDGLKVFMRGMIPSSVSTAVVEMYAEGRYFTVTGRHYEGTPQSINCSDDALSALYTAVKKTKTTERKQYAEGTAIPAGGRHEAILTRTREVFQLGLRGPELVGAVQAFNENRCSPPKEIAEIEKVVGWVEENIDEPDPVESPTEAVPAIIRAVFIGPRLAELAERPVPPPTHPLHPPRKHFSATIGPSFGGKSSQAYWQSMSRGSGVAPWSGAPTPEPSRTLIFSPDEPVEAVARRIKSLALTHPAGSRFNHFEHISVLGLDETVDADLLEGLRLDDDGFARWDNLLEALRPEYVIIDAYGDVLPNGVSENDNDHARRVGSALESLAVKHGTAINVLHHVGKQPAGTATTDIDVRDLGRGASALAQKARAVFTFEELKGQNHLRRSRCRVNGGPSPSALDIEVCDTGLERQEIVFFKTHDPLAHYSPSQFLESGGWISTTQLARRLDQYLNPKEDRDPPGPMKSLAGELRSEWVRAGLISVRDGSRNSKEMTLGTA